VNGDIALELEEPLDEPLTGDEVKIVLTDPQGNVIPEDKYTVTLVMTENGL
jgi:hypothetical protein